MRTILLVVLIALPVPANVALAHSGGVDASGCHNDNRRGGYHCHGGGAAVRAAPVSRRTAPNALVGTFNFRNCAEARAAGAAPVRRGDAGYGRHLDRDGDGVGCE